MPAASNYLESQLLTHIFRTSSFSKPSTIAIGLVGVLLDDTEVSDVSGKEIANAGSYARVDVGAPDDGDWDAIDQVNASGHTQNTAEVAFTTASADWGWVSGMFIADSATWGTGNILFHGGLATAKLVGNGDQIKFSAGNIDIYLS